jgi:4-carboxymuconolactone decarboxylase
MSRIEPLSDYEFTAAVGFDIPKSDTTSPVNLVMTMARNPRLAQRWISFGTRLMGGALLARHRELVILRTGARCGSAYEWGQHVLISREVGLTDVEIQRVLDGPDADGWTSLERALLRSVDELHDTCRISPELWAVLATELDDAQLVELPMLVGHYTMVAYTANALEVELDLGLPPFPGISTS